MGVGVERGGVKGPKGTIFNCHMIINVNGTELALFSHHQVLEVNGTPMLLNAPG